MDEIVIKPIGLFHCEQIQPVDSPRQGVLAEQSHGFIKLSDEISLESLRDLEGFSHIWLVYQFHQNQDWKPMVRPPRNSQKKRGVFATRSPYRPSGIGISCVEFEKIEGGKIFCRSHDLLDQTPILDIKPYLVYSDCFPDATRGWTQNSKKFAVESTAEYREKVKWLENETQKNLHSIFVNQLSFEPDNGKIKRVTKTEEGFCFSYRTWRVDFEISGEKVILKDIRSGYSKEELDSQNDPYRDKSTHRNFVQSFLY